jgi:hypothetical protein
MEPESNINYTENLNAKSAVMSSKTIIENGKNHCEVPLSHELGATKEVVCDTETVTASALNEPLKLSSTSSELNHNRCNDRYINTRNVLNKDTASACSVNENETKSHATIGSSSSTSTRIVNNLDDTSVAIKSEVMYNDEDDDEECDEKESLAGEGLEDSNNDEKADEDYTHFDKTLDENISDENDDDDDPEEEEQDETEDRFENREIAYNKRNSPEFLPKVCIEDELKFCKGKLEAFGNELKILCAELDIVTGWIDQQFGIFLRNCNGS